MCEFLDPHRWANLFAMEYMIQYTKSKGIMFEYEDFAKRWVEMMETGDDDPIGKTKELLEKWHKKVLEDRIHDIMKNDDKEENT
ncbi:hypothetical protein D3C73_1405930 [compost metagenome]